MCVCVDRWWSLLVRHGGGANSDIAVIKMNNQDSEVRIVFILKSFNNLQKEYKKYMQFKTPLLLIKINYNMYL